MFQFLMCFAWSPGASRSFQVQMIQETLVTFQKKCLTTTNPDINSDIFIILIELIIYSSNSKKQDKPTITSRLSQRTKGLQWPCSFAKGSHHRCQPFLESQKWLAKNHHPRHLPSLKLTVHTWNTGVGRWVLFWLSAYFQVRAVSFREGSHPSWGLLFVATGGPKSFSGGGPGCLGSGL